jgi:hypothetical protein
MRREGMLVGAALLLVALFQVLAWRTTAPPPRPDSVSKDAYGSLGVRDVRFAVETFRTAQGRYPETLGELVASGWLTEKQLRPGGWSLLYAATSDSTFQIDVAQRP